MAPHHREPHRPPETPPLPGTLTSLRLASRVECPHTTHAARDSRSHRIPGRNRARIDEARRVRWQDVNLEQGRVYLRGTKSETSDRWLNLPDWLVEQLAARAADCSAGGYVFAAPAQRDRVCGTKATARERFAPLWTRAG